MQQFNDAYRRLNTAQKRAVDAVYGPVLVVAGPGTGKTQLLSARVAQILRVTDALPQNILCLTFTESGARNMRDRLVSFIGQEAYDVQIGASAAVSLDNLKAAINASGTPGTEYFAGTEAHPDVIATTNTDTTQVVEAKLPGTAGNSIATTETSTHLSWGAGTLASGADGNFDEYVPAGGTIDVALDEDVDILSFIGDAGTASVSVVEY